MNNASASLPKPYPKPYPKRHPQGGASAPVTATQTPPSNAMANTPSRPGAAAPTTTPRSHLVRDPQSQAVRVQFPATHPNSDTATIEECLNKRLAASARGPQGPRPSARACRAANELVAVLLLMKLSSEECLSLVQCTELWDAFVEPRELHPFVAVPPGTGGAPDGDLHLAPPVHRRAIAALMRALIQRGMNGQALALLTACPADVDRRLVLKCLIDLSDPPGGLLRHITQPEHVVVIEATLADMRSCTDSRGKPRYAGLDGLIKSLREHWHAPPRRQHLIEARERLWRCGCVIDTGPQGRTELVRVAHQPLDRHALDALLHYGGIALQDTDLAPTVPALLRDALSSLGLELRGPGAGGLPQWAGQAQRDAATDFVRQCCTLLLGAPQDAASAALVDGLLGLSLALNDGGLLTDPAFACAASAAMQRDGQVWPWLLSQWSPRQAFPAQVMDALAQALSSVPSASRALQCIHAITRGLATLQTLAEEQQDPERQRAWQQARQALLPAMVAHFGALLQGPAGLTDSGWEPMAQWVWVTGAALSLPPQGDGLWRPAPQASPLAALQALCLRFLYQHSVAFAPTLALLCHRGFLAHAIDPRIVTARHVLALFSLCPLATRQAVLRLPALALWMRSPASLNILTFVTDNALPLEQQATQILGFIDAGIPLSGLPAVLAGVLNTATFTQRLALRVPDPRDGWWLAQALAAWIAQLSESNKPVRPQGLANLLDLYRRATFASAPGLERHGHWTMWLSVVRDLAALKNQAQTLETQDWVLLGAYLPLDPDVGWTRQQIAQLGEALPHKTALIHLLQGWLNQRFAEASDAGRDTQEVLQQQASFQAVWQSTKALLKTLTRTEREALGREFSGAFIALAKRYEALFKRQ